MLASRRAAREGEMGCNWGWVGNGSRCGVMLTGDTLSGISPRTKEADAKQ